MAGLRSRGRAPGCGSARARPAPYLRETDGAANAVSAGAEARALEPGSYPSRQRRRRRPCRKPDTAAALLACTGPVPHLVVGKPEPALFLKGLALLGIQPPVGIVVGDNPGDGWCRRNAPRITLHIRGSRPAGAARRPQADSSRRPATPRAWAGGAMKIGGSRNHGPHRDKRTPCCPCCHGGAGTKRVRGRARSMAFWGGCPRCAPACRPRRDASPNSSWRTRPTSSTCRSRRLPSAAHSSEGSVVGLCQQLGARGFQQIKIALARDLVQPVQFIHEDLSRDDKTATVLGSTRQRTQALQDTLKVLDAAQMNARRERHSQIAARRGLRHRQCGPHREKEDANYRLMGIGIETKVVVNSHVQASQRVAHGSARGSASRSSPSSRAAPIEGSSRQAPRLARRRGATATGCIHQLRQVAAAHARRHRASYHGEGNPVPHRGHDQPHRAARDERRRLDRFSSRWRATYEAQVGRYDREDLRRSVDQAVLHKPLICW